MHLRDASGAMLPSVVQPMLVSCSPIDLGQRTLCSGVEGPPTLTFWREQPPIYMPQAMEWVCPVGEKVWVKVVEVTEDPMRGPKVACSMKVVDQNDGCASAQTQAQLQRGGAFGVLPCCTLRWVSRREVGCHRGCGVY